MERIGSLTNTLCAAEGKKNTLTVTDNRSGKTYEIPIRDNHIQSSYFGKIKGEDGEPLRYYDPGYTNTICCVTPTLHRHHLSVISMETKASSHTEDILLNSSPSTVLSWKWHTCC